jgi:hypothetical protein
VVAAAEEQGELHELREIRNGGSDGRRDGRYEDVTILHVADLVTEHGAELTLTQHVEDALSDGNDGVVRIAPGGERVGLNPRDQDHARLGDPRPLSELANDRVQSRSRRLVDRLRPVNGQHQPVREEIGTQVQRACQDER